MPEVISLLLLATCAAAITAVVLAARDLHRHGRLTRGRRAGLLALGALCVPAVLIGVVALQPESTEAADTHVFIAPSTSNVDVQLPTLGLDD